MKEVAMQADDPAAAGGGFWSGLRVVVTGGAGFLGSFVVDELRARGGPRGLRPALPRSTT